MSKLGKILLYVALAGVVATAIAGWMVIQKNNTQKADYTAVTLERDSVKREVTKAKQEADAAAQAKAASDTELKEAQVKVTDLTSKLTDAQKAQDDLKTAVQQATDATKKAEDQAKHVTDVLGMSPEDAKAAIKKAQDELANSQSEQKILQDQLQATTAQISDLKEAINRSKTGTQPPGISGKVTFVNRAWNFVVLNVGLSNGVVPNGELYVYRGNSLMGKVRITSAEGDTSVADILPDAKGDIQKGDNVLN